jgi:hypothetical protein
LGVTGARDMIYVHLGILGLDVTESKLKKMVRVDYDQPISGLFTQVASYMISARGVGILSHVEDIPLQNRTSLPSWVPHWSLPNIFPLASIHLKEQARYIEIGMVCVPLQSPQVGLISTFACSIEVVLDSCPPVNNLEALCNTVLRPQHNHFSEDNGQEKLFHQVTDTIQDRLCEWLGKQRLTPPNYYDPKVIAYIWDQIEGLLDNPSRPFRPVQKEKDTSNGYRTNLVTALLLAITDEDLSDGFPGMKIAVLEDKNLISVPMSAQAGDVICHFCPRKEPWVLRRAQPGNHVDPEVALRDWFRMLASEYLNSDRETELAKLNWWLSNSQGQAYTVADALEDMTTARVDHFNFIGECILDIDNRSRWEYNESDGVTMKELRPQIVTLH